MENNIPKEIESLKSKADGLSILYVEDEKDLRDRIASLFNKIFANVDVAADGKEGLDKYLNNKYDISLI